MKIKKLGFGIAPRLRNKGIEIVVHENFTKGSNWNTLPYTRYFLLKNGKQIDGFDVRGRKVSKKEIKTLLRRNNLTTKGVIVYVKRK